MLVTPRTFDEIILKRSAGEYDPTLGAHAVRRFGDCRGIVLQHVALITHDDISSCSQRNHRSHDMISAGFCVCS